MKAIMYHYVRPFDSEFPNLKSLHIDDFKAQLDYFEEEYGFISKDDFMNCIQTGETLDGVVLTFDDGLSCHYNHVFPELQKRGLWGLFYVPTQPYVEGKLLDVHRIHVLLGKNSPIDVYNFLIDLVDGEMFDRSKYEEFKKLTYQNQINDQYSLMVKRMLNYFIDYSYRGKVLDELMRFFISNEEILKDNFYLTKTQIKQMSDSGMEIGSHSIHHKVMSRLDFKDQQDEIDSSFELLNNIVGKKISTFCYPYGGFHSFNKDTELLLEKVGCKYSFNVEERDIEKFDILERPQALPRYDCNFFKYGQVRN